MIFEIDDWKFDIDLERTMSYSAQEAAGHCDCAYCRNFYAGVDGAYPKLRSFLTQFGVDVEAPDEQMPYDLDGRMYYDSVYMVCGRILQFGRKPIVLDRLLVQPIDASDISKAIHINHACPSPCFALDLSTVTLPWVLDEPMNETVSPANEPIFLKKMWDRLLAKLKKSQIQ